MKQNRTVLLVRCGSFCGFVFFGFVFFGFVFFGFVGFAVLRVFYFVRKDKLGVVGVFLERTKYRIRVGRGLAPAVNLHRTPRRGQAPALPWKFNFVRRGRRLGAPYPLPLRGRWLLPQAKDGGREMKKSLPQSNATHLTAPSSEGAETAGAS